jgi:hypothetical protein
VCEKFLVSDLCCSINFSDRERFFLSRKNTRDSMRFALVSRSEGGIKVITGELLRLFKCILGSRVIARAHTKSRPEHMFRTETGGSRVFVVAGF